MRNSIIFTLLLLILASCIDPIAFKFDGQTSHLVVFSNFSSKKGPQFVRLTRSVPFDSPYKVFVKNARVLIKSASGKSFEFFHTASGEYYTLNDAEVEPGETYILHIEVDGEIYESDPSRAPSLEESVDMTEVHLKEDVQQVNIPGEKEPRSLPGYAFLVDYQDKAGQANFLRWSYYREYQVFTQPWNFIDYFCPRGCPRPAPKSCCKECYVTNKEEYFKVVNDRLTDGRLVRNIPVSFMQYYQLMNSRMKFTIYQHNISEEAYTYYKSLEAQAESSGTMLDAPPTEVVGNMHNINKPEELVIGFFEVSTVFERNFIFNPLELPIDLPPFEFPDDCRVITGASVNKPIGFDQDF